MGMGKTMTVEKPIEMIRRFLKKDANVDFLLKLNPSELEALLTLMRNRVGQGER